MNDDRAHRNIAALKAVVQALMREVYCGAGVENGRRLFDGQLEDDQLLALAISNELRGAALAEAFTDSGAGDGPAGDEVASSPLAPYLEPGQRQRASVALLGHRESDNAHTLAVRTPDVTGLPAVTAEERVRIGEEAFLGRMEINVLREGEAWSDFMKMAKADPEERIAHLPEPWRKQARKRLPELRTRIRETLERKRVRGAVRS